jgi:hypothetical protein
MSAKIDASGEIEILCYPTGSAARTYVPFFDGVGVGDHLSLIFAVTEDATAPYALKIYSPSGANILDTIVRELPTATPQSPPAIQFVVSTKGVYRVEIREVRGRKRGEASVRIG